MRAGTLQLRTGDVVQVRPSAEILATLDERSCTAGMPFMPEMLAQVGKQFTVSNRIDKICNNVDMSQGSARRMRSVVQLEDLRCDGSAHGGCQMACRLMWREEWLQPVEAGSPGVPSNEATAGLDELSFASAAFTVEADGESVEAYRCQATEIVAASAPLNKLDPRQFVREVRSGNVTVAHLVAVVARTVWFKTLRVVKLRKMLPLEVAGANRESPAPIGLQPGDFVEVRSREEIARTLDESGNNRGLLFAPEMVRYAGRRFRVRDRVHRLIDETNGRMIMIKTDCLILEGAICPGEDGCWAYLFCHHGTYPLWREAWLRRVDEDAARTHPIGESVPV